MPYAQSRDEKQSWSMDAVRHHVRQLSGVAACDRSREPGGWRLAGRGLVWHGVVHDARTPGRIRRRLLPYASDPRAGRPSNRWHRHRE
jgi:hypothetical protein